MKSGKLILFSVKREIKKLYHFSWSVTCRFCETREELELLTYICDLTTLFFVILRRKSPEWLESYLGMQFAVRSLYIAFHHFAVFKRSF